MYTVIKRENYKILHEWRDHKLFIIYERGKLGEFIYLFVYGRISVAYDTSVQIKFFLIKKKVGTRFLDVVFPTLS